jgi:hypothetical protein
MAAETLRILVSIEPRMYCEVLAFYFSKQHPQAEVVLASPQTLRDKAKHTRPHLIVANMVPSELKEMCYWVEVRADETLSATINADGYSDVIQDASLEDLLAAVEKAEEDLVDRS